AEEQNFARNGMMDETQAVQIGKIAGASKVLFSVLASSGTRNMLTTKLVDFLLQEILSTKHSSALPIKRSLHISKNA
ncbi:MAG: hypothetical protein J6Q47_00820, partial [Paludibacteraceae bacterium]|nr:hypothetical protein [Paludibacteraceae bacterium]